MHFKVLIALIGVASGIVLGELYLYGSELSMAVSFLGLLQLALYFLERYFDKKNGHSDLPKHFSIPLLSGIFCITVAIGIVRVQFIEEKNNFLCKDVCSFVATITTYPQVKGAYQILQVAPVTDERVYNVQVKVPLYPVYKKGESIVLSGKVTEPHAYMEHSGVKPFNYREYLRVHGVGSEMLYPKVELLRDDRTDSFFTHVLPQVREHFLATIARYVNEPSASLATGMLFGNDSMSKELTTTFRTAGLSHIVVLSGFNIAILISFVLFILKVVPLFLRVSAAAVFVLLFVMMVGAEASIVRATLMASIGLIAMVIGRAYVARQALLLSLLLIILYEPLHLLYDVSLHLSFLATAGIVYAGNEIEKLIKHFRSSLFVEIMTTTFAAYIATLPYVMYTFGTVSLYALFTNLIVLPVVPLMMLSTFMIIVVAPLSGILGTVFGYVTTMLGTYVIFVAKVVEGLPLSSLPSSLSLWMMYTLYVGMIFFLYICSVQKNKYAKNETTVTKSDEILSGVIRY